jgi:hypothetical protein
VALDHPLGSGRGGASGALDAAGQADVAIPVPASLSAFIGAEFDAQGVVDTVGGPRLTNARRVVVSGY